MKFSPNNLASFAYHHVFENSRPIVLVAHEDQVAFSLWSLSDHGDDGHLVGVEYLAERDPTINECTDLPNEFEAQLALPDQP